MVPESINYIEIVNEKDLICLTDNLLLRIVFKFNSMDTKPAL